MQDFRYDYSGMGEWLRGQECAELVYEKADKARQLYQAIVARRTGKLSESARVEMSYGSNGRHVSHLVVGGDQAVYGLSHEFGNTDLDPADDLNVVLGLLGTI